jgi:GNAT superfamily N-acetyltransferase
VIRRSEAADSGRIQEVDVSAGTRFAEIGMQWVADHEPTSLAELDEYARAGHSWVAVDGDSGVIVGYVVVDLVDGCAHVEQLSVERTRQGEGFGKALIAEVESWASDEGIPALTLTTFSSVDWNGPLYEHLGFAVVEEGELSPGLKAIRGHERERGLEPPRRICMRKAVSRIRSD